MAVVCDTGAVYALYDADDVHHAACKSVIEKERGPLCSAVYCVGMPGSLNTVVQFLGRAMRLKGPDYPAEQRDRAKLVFFVPCAGAAALTDLSIDHSRHALLTCCFLADHEVGQEWIVTQAVAIFPEVAHFADFVGEGKGVHSVHHRNYFFFLLDTSIPCYYIHHLLPSPHPFATRIVNG